MPLISIFNARVWAAIFRRRAGVLAWFAGLAGFAQSGTAAVELVFAAPNAPVSDRFENDGREIKLEGCWELRGDLKSAAVKIDWSPACSVGRLTRWRFSARSQSACQALVTLNAGAPGGWTVEQLKGSIAVFTVTLTQRISPL